MDWNKIAGKAKEVIDQRGGSESVKEDVEELLDIADGEGPMSEKLKQAAAALKEPGAHHEDPGERSAPASGLASDPLAPPVRPPNPARDSGA